MKKIIYIMVLVLICSCSKKEEIVQEKVIYKPLIEESEETKQKIEETVSSTDGVDEDLSLLSGTMIYSRVYDIMMNPEEFIGKTMKIHGVLSKEYIEEENKYFYAILITDAMACCQQGIEFQPVDADLVDENLEVGILIEIQGVFEKYKSNDLTYYYLKIDHFLVI